MHKNWFNHFKDFCELEVSLKVRGWCESNSEERTFCNLGNDTEEHFLPFVQYESGLFEERFFYWLSCGNNCMPGELRARSFRALKNQYLKFHLMNYQFNNKNQLFQEIHSIMHRLLAWLLLHQNIFQLLKML